MVWKPTATTFTWPPVSFSQSGARRWSGSATWGPLNVRMLTLTPLNLSPGDVAGPAALGAGPLLVAAGTEAAAPLLDAGEMLGAALHAVSTRIRPTAMAIDRNRDTGSLLLDPLETCPTY